MAIPKIFLVLSTCVLLISSVYAKCSFFEQVVHCSSVSKAIFARAQSVAAAASTAGCKTMTSSQWAKVGCHNPYSHRFTKVCAPTKWSAILELFATAIALKEKILVKSPYTMSKLFNTKSGQRLMRHELRHIKQQSGVSSYTFGLRYITAYCDAGCSYFANRYEVEARSYEPRTC